MTTLTQLTLDKLNWEATATLVAGFLAVLAAFVIGFRQSGIQSRQVELEELKIRSDLFDKRFATYEATAYLLNHIDLHIEEKDQILMKAWFAKFRESKFLFSPPVYEQLSEILSYYNSYLVNQRSINDLHGYNSERKPALSKEETRLVTWIAKRIGTVHEIFEPDLKLTIPQARRSWRWSNPVKRKG
jgi:hypothetical protein